MTVLAGATSILMALLVTLGGLLHARNLAVESRAQAAADAAALAAVAESLPYGAGVHRYEARRFAELNGAELLSCVCYAGATAVRVEVSLDGARATARAAADLDLLMPAVSDGELHPTLERSVQILIDAADGAVSVTSGFRSTGEQRKLWDAAVARWGDAAVADDWVARPGTSKHERGLAVDLSGDVELAARLVTEMGLPLHRPVPNEPWHFELIGGGTARPV